MIASSPGPRRRVLDMDGYQWTVLLAAWLGWGFDAFDSLLFNFVSPNCIPTLLGLDRPVFNSPPPNPHPPPPGPADRLPARKDGAPEGARYPAPPPPPRRG